MTTVNSPAPVLRRLKPVVLPLLPLFDALWSPIVVLSALVMRLVRRVGLDRLPVSRRVLARVGVLPVRAHYYEPYVTPAMLRAPLDSPRFLPGLDLNAAGQLAFLEPLRATAHETREFPRKRTDGKLSFAYNNDFFDSGDAEVLYGIVRTTKPQRIVEVGSGHSTLLVRAALARANPACNHVCIEPYENPWLADTGARIVKTPVERVDRALFTALESGDVLFIDSSHMIRPQGDVLAEVLEILPLVRPGVLVHIHDIFTPRDYPKRWVLDEARLWNEQYLVEAFLSENREWEIVAALNFLHHEHREALAAVAPVYAEEAARRQPGSLWIRRKPR